MPQGGVLKVSFPSKFPGGDHSNVFLQNGSGHVFWKMVLKSCRVWLILYHSKCVDSQRDSYNDLHGAAWYFHPDEECSLIS
jgi:hypothetical protein